MHRRTRLATAGLAVAATSMLAVAPAANAAQVLSRADASAATVSIAGQGGSTGPVEATWDGENESVSGTSTPAIPTGGFLNAGVLTQQATAGGGFARACAGVAGTGGGIIQLGDGSCLTPGNTLDGSLTGLSLGDLTGNIEQLPPELKTVLDQLTGPLDQAIDQVIAPIEEQAGDLGLVLRLDAVEGRCSVDGSTPSGSASIANAKLVATGAGQDVVLAELPANPAPNTRVLTDLSKVVDVLLSGVQTDLQNSLDGALSPVDEALLAPVREQLVAGIRDNLEEQLAPLEDNVLRVTLNEQTFPTSDSIKVNALHAEVLPVAESQLGAAAVDVKIGSVGCGPAGTVVAGETPPAEPQAAPPKAPTRIPTAVSAGVAGEPDRGDLAPYAVLAVGVAAAGGAGWSAWRRRSALRG